MPASSPTTLTEPDAPIVLPWGEADNLRLELPRSWPAAEVVRPDLEGTVDDYPAALRQALDDCGLGTGVGPGSTVAIVVDDPSRWTPVREALPIILDRIQGAGVRTADVSISVGVGRHHAVDDPAMRARVGDAVVDAYRCFSPPVDDLSAYLDLGTTPRGIPVRVFRPVAEADLRILVGSVLPHLQAGFGGGYKLIFPGTSHRSTLGALHRQGLGRGADAAALLGGDPAANPMRQAIVEAAALVGPCVSISHLIGAPGQIVHVAAGDPTAVQQDLAARARRRFQAPATAPPADLIVAGNHPWPGDPMQSFKVLLQHRAACRRGGVLVGFFWTDPDQIDRSFPMPALRAIAAAGAPGGWLLRRGLAMAAGAASATSSPAAFMLRWARELVVDRAVLVFAPPLFERLGPRLGPIRLFGDQDALWRAAADALAAGGVSAPSVRVFPQGGLTYAPEAPVVPPAAGAV